MWSRSNLDDYCFCAMCCYSERSQSNILIQVYVIRTDRMWMQCSRRSHRQRSKRYVRIVIFSLLSTVTWVLESALGKQTGGKWMIIEIQRQQTECEMRRNGCFWQLARESAACLCNGFCVPTLDTKRIVRTLTHIMSSSGQVHCLRIF